MLGAAAVLVLLWRVGVLIATPVAGFVKAYFAEFYLAAAGRLSGGAAQLSRRPSR